MSYEHQIVSQVEAAKTDRHAADELIAQYLPFIKSETASFIGRPPVEGRDDELSIAMLAFYEAILAYDKGRGGFLRFAATGIRNRLIDNARCEKRHSGLISYDEPAAGESGTPLIDSIADQRDRIGEATGSIAAKSEIQEFSRQLSDFGVSLSDVADNCPRQERTLDACYCVLGYAKANPALLRELVRTRRLPITELERSGVSRKTIDRHRKYLVAILLAYTNGYEIIRGHLSGIPAGKGGR